MSVNLSARRPAEKAPTSALRRRSARTRRRGRQIKPRTVSRSASRSFSPACASGCAANGRRRRPSWRRRRLPRPADAPARRRRRLGRPLGARVRPRRDVLPSSGPGALPGATPESLPPALERRPRVRRLPTEEARKGSHRERPRDGVSPGGSALAPLVDLAQERADVRERPQMAELLRVDSPGTSQSVQSVSRKRRTCKAPAAFSFASQSSSDLSAASLASRGRPALDSNSARTRCASAR